MSKSSELLKGVIWVALGAASYGVLATMVRLAYDKNYTTGEVVFSQYLIGLVVLGLIFLIQKNSRSEVSLPKASSKQLFNLILAGTSMGFTGIFYYQAIHYLPVSICIILLMQSVWLGVVFEMLLTKKNPGVLALVTIITVLVGTAFATNVWKDWSGLHPKGVIWGFLAAISYTTTIFAGNRVGLGLAASQRSFWMMVGGFFVVLCYVFPEFFGVFKWDIFLKWGILLAIFGTIIPPLFMNHGLPITGLGLGSIVASIEIPVSVFSAFLILHEEVLLAQWFGVALIILAVVFMNFPRKTLR
ncbi:MAG: DMT family transporter [Crocinitomicaceae bacterium]